MTRHIQHSSGFDLSCWEVAAGCHLLGESAALGRWGLEQQEHSPRAVICIYKSDADALNEQLCVQRKRPDAAGVHTHVPDEQVARDMAAVHCAG